MTLSTSFLATAALAFIAGVNGHCIMKNPIPFDQASINSSPLADDGSDYPCKFGGMGYTSTITSMNNITVGEENELSIMGGATHGGGSCQVSVTLDKVPTKNSQFKVVHSIIGGCPNPAPGNAADVATYANNPTFKWSLPKGMPNGEYTMAWSWLNHIGNREFYMNCAPISVTGGGSDNSVFDKLPDMFVANINPQCETAEGQDFSYPNPGDSVETGSAAKPGTSFLMTAACASVTNMGAGNGSPASATAGAGGSGAGSSAAGSSSGGGMIGSSASAPATTAAASASASAGGGVFAPGASSAAATTMATSVAPVPAATSAPAAAAPSSAAASAPAAAPSSGSSSGSSGSSGSGAAGQVACTAEGFYCIDDTHFGMCANGFATPMSVADGTKCSAGKVDFAQKQVVPGTKFARHFRSHIHRRNAFGYDF